MAYQISNRQFNVMRLFERVEVMPLTEVMKLDQRPVAGLLQRGVLEFSKGHFRLSGYGVHVMMAFRNTEIHRKNPQAPPAKIIAEHLEVKGTNVIKIRPRKIA